MIQNKQITDRNFFFLSDLDRDLRISLLQSLRDLWTHTSTALEGNTFTLGDTAFFLSEGLTIGGKTLREHGEIYGHAYALEEVYDLVESNIPLTKEKLFSLHKLIQTNAVIDVYNPIGDWKVEPNGTYAIDKAGKSFFLEYPAPSLIPDLMKRWIEMFNLYLQNGCIQKNAPEIFAILHTSFVRIHPFADGNGRLARLLANVPLLHSGLPPILILNEERRKYIDLLSLYEQDAGELIADVPLVPHLPSLVPFIDFCAAQWRRTWELIDAVRKIQAKRDDDERITPAL